MLIEKNYQHLVAKKYYSGFDKAHDTYNALTAASNGKIYYVLSSESINIGGKMYVYDPKTDQIELIGDLTEICGEKDKKSIPQGKSHVGFEESKGKLYFATHIGYYELMDGMERLPMHPPEGHALYSGGHLLSYDLNDGSFQKLAIVPDGEGVLTMTMDKVRGQIYCITWPNGNFLHYDLKEGKLENYGSISARGEAGTPGKDYRVLCRSMFVDPGSARVYFSTAEGNTFAFCPTKKSIQCLDEVSMRLDYFGVYKTNQAGNMGYNWRKIFWFAPEEIAYGIHGNSGYLFRFDPQNPSIEIVERITSLPSKKSGMFDQFSYGYLGFQLGPDNETIYYLTGGPIYNEGKRLEGEKRIAKGGARGLENLHLITYHIPNQKYEDHGPVFYADGSQPTYVNSIAIGKDGCVYALARFIHHGKLIQDLIKITSPLH